MFRSDVAADADLVVGRCLEVDHLEYGFDELGKSENGHATASSVHSRKIAGSVDTEMGTQRDGYQFGL